MYEKGLSSSADLVILDLEDAVGANEKDDARRMALEFASSREWNDKLCVIRINSPNTAHGKLDMATLAELYQTKSFAPDLIVVPKVESATDITTCEQVLNETATGFIAMIETAQGFFDLRQIVSNVRRLVGLAFGSADFTNDMNLLNEWSTLYHYRAMLALAARANKLFVLDAPFFAYRDLNGLRDETLKIKNMGFDGKLVIHPAQVSIVHQVFKPTEFEIELAEKIVKMFQESNGNVCHVEDLMVDEPIYQKALLLLSRR
jgi:(S)-citramalyl-CoA lyase